MPVQGKARSTGDVDAELLGWIRQAYDSAGGPTSGGAWTLGLGYPYQGAFNSERSCVRRLGWVRAFVVLLGLSLGLFVGYRSTASPLRSGGARSVAEVAQQRLARIQQTAGAEPDAGRLRDWMRRSLGRLPVSRRSLRSGGQGGAGDRAAAPLLDPAGPRGRRREQRRGRRLGRGDPADIGGRAPALLADPTNPKVLYAGGVSGGIWKSENRGSSWRSISNSSPPYVLSNLAISAMAFDPRDSRVIYAGTGEGIVSGPLGVGIYKSGDAGAHWGLLNRTFIDGHVAPTYVNDLVVSSSGERLYAATAEGIFRVTATGSLWQRIYNPRTPDGCTDLALRPGGSSGPDADDLLVASCGSSSQTVVVRNVRAQNSDSPWVTVLDEPGMGRTSLAFAPSRRNVLYAVATHVNQPGLGTQPSKGLHAVYRSDCACARGSFEGRGCAGVSVDAARPLAPLLLSYALIATGSSAGPSIRARSSTSVRAGREHGGRRPDGPKTASSSAASTCIAATTGTKLGHRIALVAARRPGLPSNT